MNAEDLDQLTYEDLKDMCEARNMDSLGDKKTLIKTIVDYENQLRLGDSTDSKFGVHKSSQKSAQEVIKEQHRSGRPNQHVGISIDEAGGGAEATDQICIVCGSPIKGKLLVAMGQNWHPEHFQCTHCKQSLQNQRFFENNGQPYCEDDYRTLFSPRCDSCKEPISRNCISALGKQWHQEHFVCTHCKIMITQKSFRAKDDKPYCNEHYISLFAPKCISCHKNILGGYVTALNSQWHEDCFVCYDCKIPLAGCNFYSNENSPYCESCNWSFKRKKDALYKRKTHSIPDIDHEGKEVISTETVKTVHNAMKNGVFTKTTIFTTTFRYSDGSTRDAAKEYVETF